MRTWANGDGTRVNGDGEGGDGEGGDGKGDGKGEEGNGGEGDGALIRRTGRRRRRELGSEL